MKAFKRGILMEYILLEKEINNLLTAAIRKCGNINDAEDLTQETLLCAISYLSKGNKIDNLRAWLITVLSHKWNDLLRKRYNQNVISLGEGFDIAYEDEDLINIGLVDEAEEIRKEVSYLAKIYREVIVKHYMYGKSVSEIADELNIPIGTVKSRLHGGREQMKKGLTQMEKYNSQSYNPIRLLINNSGNNGLNREPNSLIQGDLLAQNILWLAYDSPKTVEEISRLIGVPTAYIEPVIDKLVNGELMKKVGSRYYTDFIIFTLEEKEQYIPSQISFVKEYFNNIWTPIGQGIRKLKEKEYYKRMTFDEKNSLEMYFAFNCLDYGIYDILSRSLYERVGFPYRKDGGRWIAFGEVHFKDFSPMDHLPYMMHLYSGERQYRINNYANSKILQLSVYGAEGFPDYPYNRSRDYTFLKSTDEIDEIIMKLMYILKYDISPESVGFNEEYLKAIPHLLKCKILRVENGRTIPNVPIINKEEYNDLCNLLNEAKSNLVNDKVLEELLFIFCKDKKTNIPSHLTSVPQQKQFQYSSNAILFSTIREAISKGELYDGNYDDDTEKVNQHPCPMFLVIE